MSKKYIDADAIQDRAFQLNFDFRITERELAIVNRLLLEAPTADVVEVKHGKWIEKWSGHFKTDVPRCSLCFNASPFKYNYCPTCGADMGRKEDAEEIR